MTKEHSTKAAWRLHQFLRVTFVSVLLLAMLLTAPEGGVTIQFTLTELLAAIAGVLTGEVVDWIMWYVCERVVGR